MAIPSFITTRFATPVVTGIVREADQLTARQVIEMVRDIDAIHKHRRGGPAPRAVRPERGRVAVAILERLKGMPSEDLLRVRAEALQRAIGRLTARRAQRREIRARAERADAAEQAANAAQYREHARQIVAAIWDTPPPP